MSGAASASRSDVASSGDAAFVVDVAVMSAAAATTTSTVTRARNMDEVCPNPADGGTGGEA
jgi:hypothetical protein